MLRLLVAFKQYSTARALRSALVALANENPIPANEVGTDDSKNDEDPRYLPIVPDGDGHHDDDATAASQLLSIIGGEATPKAAKDTNASASSSSNGAPSATHIPSDYLGEVASEPVVMATSSRSPANVYAVPRPTISWTSPSGRRVMAEAVAASLAMTDNASTTSINGSNGNVDGTEPSTPTSTIPTATSTRGRSQRRIGTTTPRGSLRQQSNGFSDDTNNNNNNATITNNNGAVYATAAADRRRRRLSMGSSNGNNSNNNNNNSMDDPVLQLASLASAIVAASSSSTLSSSLSSLSPSSSGIVNIKRESSGSISTPPANGVQKRSASLPLRYGTCPDALSAYVDGRIAILSAQLAAVQKRALNMHRSFPVDDIYDNDHNTDNDDDGDALTQPIDEPLAPSLLQRSISLPTAPAPAPPSSMSVIDMIATSPSSSSFSSTSNGVKPLLRVSAAGSTCMLTPTAWSTHHANDIASLARKRARSDNQISDDDSSSSSSSSTGTDGPRVQRARITPPTLSPSSSLATSLLTTSLSSSLMNGLSVSSSSSIVTPLTPSLVSSTPNVTSLSSFVPMAIMAG
jgi:hypothetical protein